MGYLLYLMFRCDFDVMESLESLEKFGEVNKTRLWMEETPIPTPHDACCFCKSEGIIGIFGAAPSVISPERALQ